MRNPSIPTAGEQIIPQIDNLFKSIVLIGLMISSFYLAQIGADTIDSYFGIHSYSETVHFLVKWTFLIALGVLNNFIITGLGVLAHEGVHKVLFKNQFWNDLWSGIIFALFFLPFYANREIHLTHHRYTHQPENDPEYPIHNHNFWVAFIVGGFVAFYLHYKLLVTNLFTKFGDKRYISRVIKDVLFLLTAAFFYFYLVPNFGISIWYTFVPITVAFPFVFSLRAMSDHYSIPSVVKDKVKEQVLEAEPDDVCRKYISKAPILDSWIILTNPVMDWLWSNIHYHQVHHRYPYLSYRYLPSVFEATKHEQPYIVVKGYLVSLVNLMNKSYYSQQENINPFLITDSSK
ncbi:hypothetical protein NIES4074_21590 [Cylindrospermum sp. NIES-4074]|nr:hypothetical protein NIES4074_21590 [Cylindrospermum sp. NIES-4074]